MTATWQNSGIDAATNQFLGVKSISSLTVRLFTNNITPGVTDLISSYAECTVAGYAAVGLNPSNWTGSTVGGESTYSYPLINFNFTTNAGGTTVYGYFVTATVASVNTLMFSQQLTSPFVIPSAGGTMPFALGYNEEKF